MRRTSKPILSAFLLSALVVAGGLGVTEHFLLRVPDAQAVVGRPLTPVSYAGVARRTSRRTVRRTAYATGAYGYGGYGYGGAYAAGVATGAIMTLPAGCARVMVGGYTQYSCAGTYYR